MGASACPSSARDTRRLSPDLPRTGDRFAGLALDSTDEGALFLRDAALWLDCSVEQEIPAGDHHVVLLRVHGHATHGDATPRWSSTAPRSAGSRAATRWSSPAPR